MCPRQTPAFRPDYGHVVPEISAHLLLAHTAQVVLHINALDGFLILFQPQQLWKLLLADENQRERRDGMDSFSPLALQPTRWTPFMRIPRHLPRDEQCCTSLRLYFGKTS